MNSATYRPPRVQSAYDVLRERFTEAVMANPLRPVQTPLAKHPQARCVDIVADYLGVGDELGLIEHALTVITQAADGDDPARVRMLADAFIGRVAHLYAHEYASDLVELEANSHGPG